MGSWYYSIGGRAQGPVAEDFIITEIKNGRFALSDLVFCEGDSAWRTVGEVENFRSVFQAKAPPVPPRAANSTIAAKIGAKTDLGIEPQSSSPARAEPAAIAREAARQQINDLKNLDATEVWIVLKRGDVGGPSSYLQTGPFTLEQILNHLGSGEILYSQYAWRPGFQRWMRIGDLPEFDRRKLSREEERSIQAIPVPKTDAKAKSGVHEIDLENLHISIDDIKQNVMTYKRSPGKADKPEAAPSETTGVDLVTATPTHEDHQINGAKHFDEVTQPSFSIVGLQLNDETTGDLNGLIPSSPLLSELTPPPIMVPKAKSNSAYQANEKKKPKVGDENKSASVDENTASGEMNPLTAKAGAVPEKPPVGLSGAVPPPRIPVTPDDIARSVMEDATIVRLFDKPKVPGSPQTAQTGNSQTAGIHGSSDQAFDPDATRIMKSPSSLPKTALAKDAPQTKAIPPSSAILSKLSSRLSSATEAAGLPQPPASVPLAPPPLTTNLATPPVASPSVTKLPLEPLAPGLTPITTESLKAQLDARLASAVVATSISATTATSIPSPTSTSMKDANPEVENEFNEMPEIVVSKAKRSFRAKALRFFAAGIIAGAVLIGGYKVATERARRADLLRGTNGDQEALSKINSGAGDAQPGQPKKNPGSAEVPTNKVNSRSAQDLGPGGSGADSKVAQAGNSGLPPANLNSTPLAKTGGSDKIAGSESGDKGAQAPEAQKLAKDKVERERKHEKQVPSGPYAIPPSAVGGIKIIPAGSGKTSIVELMPARLVTEQPLLLVQTNAPVGEKITLHLKGRTGDILKLPSFDRTYTVFRSQTEPPGLDLAKAGLGAGSYKVDVDVADIHKTLQIFVGVRDAKYGVELEHHMKSIAYEQQKEKKMMFYTAKKFEGLAQALNDNYLKSKTSPHGWHSFLAGWKRDVNGANRPMATFMASLTNDMIAYPDEMKNLSAMVKQLKNQGQDLDLAVTQKREVASLSPAAITKEFTRIKQEIAVMSSRR